MKEGLKARVEEFFSLFGETSYGRLPTPILDGLASAGLSPHDRSVFQALCRWVPFSMERGAEIAETREVIVWPSTPKLVELLGAGSSASSVNRATRRLGQVGVLRVVSAPPARRRYIIPSMEELAERLQITPVDLPLSFDDYTDDMVRVMSGVPLHQAQDAFILEAISLAEENPMKKPHLDALKACTDAAVARTKQTAEKQRNKPKHLRMGAGRRKGPKTVTAQELLEDFIFRIGNGLGHFILPQVTKKNLSNMATLKRRYGPEKVRQVIEIMTTPEGWERTKKVCGKNFPSPTPGILLGFSETIFPALLQPQANRSGGAKDIETDGGITEF